MLRLVCGFPRFLLLSPFNKAGKFLCFRREAISKDLIKKLFWAAVGKINNHDNSDHDDKVIVKLSLGPEGRCDLMF